MKKYKLINPEGEEVMHATTEEKCLDALKAAQPDSVATALKHTNWSIVPFLEKEKDQASRKEVYLLGTDKDGIRYWLEAPSWDCGWYWGFGYIETYERNRKPSTARDIDSHFHWDTGIVGKGNGTKSGYSGDYCHNPIDSKVFEGGLTVFNEQEGWQLAELFARFYQLKESAAMFARGGAHVSGTDEYIRREEWAKEINEKMIPETTARIIKILTPEK